MSEEADINAGLMILEDEQMNEEREEGTSGKSSPLGECSTVIMTAEESVRGSTPDREIERGSGLSELGSSPGFSVNT